MMTTKLTCYGGVGSVTGANFLLEINEEKILIDCGMTQGGEQAEKMNRREFEYRPEGIKRIFITHAHIDHTGLIPRLIKEGFAGEIFSTPETKELASLLLLDAAKINKESETPLFDSLHVERALNLWQTFSYHEKKVFGDYSVEFLNAGHILGSAMIRFSLPSEETLVFSGDIGNSGAPLHKDTENIEGADYLLMESVYGDRNHEDKDIRREKLKKIIESKHKDGGTLLIPVFALERAQTLLYEMDNLFESGEVSSLPVFLDSPLAIKITELHERSTEDFNTSVQKELNEGDRIFRFPQLKLTANVRESKEIMNTHGPKIILAGSGMSTAGRITAHEKIYLPDARNTILFAGYQAPGTLGREIEEGAKKVIIDDEEVFVRARIEKIDGYSAHADQSDLLTFVSKAQTSLKKVFVAMGEPGASTFLAQRIRDELGIEALVPERGISYKLSN